MPARCVWLDTPLAQAQVNLVERLLDRFGSLPTPEELREVAKREPGLHTPTSQMRTLRELEPPSSDEGFADVERVPFVRAAVAEARAGVFVAAAALREPGWEARARARSIGARRTWSSTGPRRRRRLTIAPRSRASRPQVSGPVEGAICPHGGGPPSCWCRPPLPGLLLAFARAHGVDPSRSILVGTAAAHRTLATTLAARYVAAEP